MPLPHRLLERPRHGRQEVFEDGAGAELDFGGEFLRLEVYQRAAGKRLGRAPDFKSKRKPQLEVLDASGNPCMAFEPRRGRDA